MKKSILIAVVSLLVLAFAIAMVSAAPPTNIPLFTRNQTNLTDAQNQELAPLFNQMKDLSTQMVEVRKQVIQKQVKFGNLTQEQADQHIAWMQERMEQGFGPGMMGRGPDMMRGGPGSGPMCQQQQSNK